MPEINIINLAVAPKGATHYKLSPLCFFKYSTGKDKMYYFTDGLWIKLEHWPPASTVKKIEEWTIYNNTLPLCELTYEQAGKLVKSSGMVERMNPNTNEWGVIRTGISNRYDIYRIKQKSERELFVEECAKVMREAGTNCQDNHEYFGILFDSGRFKLVKDGE